MFKGLMGSGMLGWVRPVQLGLVVVKGICPFIILDPKPAKQR